MVGLCGCPTHTTAGGYTSAVRSARRNDDIDDDNVNVCVNQYSLQGSWELWLKTEASACL
jgi:hypothetical protein